MPECVQSGAPDKAIDHHRQWNRIEVAVEPSIGERPQPGVVRKPKDVVNGGRGSMANESGADPGRCRRP